MLAEVLGDATGFDSLSFTHNMLDDVQGKPFFDSLRTNTGLEIHALDLQVGGGEVPGFSIYIHLTCRWGTHSQSTLNPKS